MIAVIASVLFCFSIGAVRAAGQQSALPAPKLADVRTRDRSLETERVEIHRLISIPAKIKRPAGKFLLLLITETGDPKASFVIDPSSVGEGVLSPTPVFVYDRKTITVKKQMLGNIDLAAGEYFLKSGANGHILCTLTLE